ncbi:hypothetical protein [Phycicoccus sp. Root101]|uniref:COG1470 family protein n=1 Tax=Phycicoccus sp. Root101 TaxID=1736421 RepID=UPI0007033398|nr:hypothetical protein [Phycicoccus sp. Root101]KQU65428.1 hypothetical protein ASC58_18315 [Phycicoccus sp. Root101]
MNARAITRATTLLALCAVLALVVVGRLPGANGGLAEGIGLGRATTVAAKVKDFTVTSQPLSVSVQRSQSATFAVTVTPSGDFTGAVVLTAAGLPLGSTATFTPGAVNVTGAAAVGSTLVVTTSATTPLGSDGFTVTGTNGSTKRTLDLAVVVSTPPAALAVAITPASVSVAPGSTATYAVGISRVNGYAGAVSLTATGPLPKGVQVVLSPASLPAGTGSGTATLQVTTGSTTPDGTTAIGVTVSGPGVSSSSATASLVVDSKVSAKPFTLSGDLMGSLYPGAPGRPVALAVTNPNNQPIKITNLGVTVSSVTRLGSAVSGCTPTDFAVRQYVGSYPLSVPANAQATRLENLGVPTSALPTVTFVNAARSQDACRGVTVNLAYTGSATNQ